MTAEGNHALHTLLHVSLHGMSSARGVRDNVQDSLRLKDKDSPSAHLLHDVSISVRQGLSDLADFYIDF